MYRHNSTYFAELCCERKNIVKNKLIIIIIVVLCLVPSVVAIVNYNTTKDAPVDMSTATAVQIDDISGRTYIFDKNSADKNEAEQAEALIRFFMQANKNAAPITGLPDSILGEKFYKVTLSNAARQENFEYYFSSDPTTCYVRAQNGLTYRINEADAATFLATTYAESVYADSELPALTVAHTQSATPDTAVWQYKNYSGDYVDADTTALVKNEVEPYELEGGLDLEFSIEPDYCLVIVNEEEGDKIWEGMLGELNTITLDKTKTVIVNVKAKWYEDSERSFCGDLSYIFSTTLTAPASFYIGMDETDAGNFVAVTATNVLKPSAVEVTSDMPNTIMPTFYKAEDNMAVGLLPIDIDTPSGTYTLTFKYGGASEDIAIKITNNGTRTTGMTVSEAVLDSARSTAALSEFESTATELMSKGSEERYFKGYFLEGVDGANTLTRGFGLEVRVNGASTSLYRNNGVDYIAAAGTDIVAANKGEVVYVGMLDYSGYMVVIEHGYGLKTWYYNLGDTVCSVGDIVEVYAGYTKMNAEILSIDEEKGTADAAVNHPLAGKTLTFTVRLDSINPGK